MIMKKILFITTVILILSACSGRKGQKRQAETHSPSENQEAVTEEVGLIYGWQHEDIDWNSYRVFYAILENDGGYHISKSLRMFIIDEKLVIEEIPHEPFVYAITGFEKISGSLIHATLDNRIMSWQYYGDLLSSERLHWYKTERSGETVMKLTKNESTLIWSVVYDEAPARVRFIDSYDVLLSGYYYQNQRTKLHDPANEDFRKPKRSKQAGVFDLDEKPIVITADSGEYERIEKSFNGKWLEITMTDIGYVVYDYPSWFDDGKTHSPISIEIDGDTLTSIFPSDPADVSRIEQVMIYSSDNSFCFKVRDFYYSFKWIDKDKRICQWTQYYEQNGNISIWNQNYYINEDCNEFPVIMYDWE